MDTLLFLSIIIFSEHFSWHCQVVDPAAWPV